MEFGSVNLSSTLREMASSGKEAKKKEEDNENSLPTAVVAIRRHHKHAYAYLDKALSIEESDGIMSFDLERTFYIALIMFTNVVFNFQDKFSREKCYF